MGKKVLVISGSYRKGGNSDTLCDEFIKGAKEAGHNVEKINLADKNIGYCRGCYACASTGHCFQKDDVEEILDKMTDADVILMATPVYFYAMCGQMKTLIDRTVPRYMKMKDKDLYFIMTAAETNPKNLERTMEEFRGFMDCYEGFREKGAVYAVGVYERGEVNGTKFINEAYEMGKNI